MDAKLKILRFVILVVIASLLVGMTTGCSTFWLAPAPDVDVNETAAAATINAMSAQLSAVPPTPIPPTEAPTQGQDIPTLVAMIATMQAMQKSAVQPTQVPSQVSATPLPAALPTIEASQVYTGSLLGCPVGVIQEQDINGEIRETAGVMWKDSALGKYKCASVFEGRFFEGHAPNDTHIIVGFFGAAERVSVFQGTNRVVPIGVDIRQLLYQHAVDKCKNWRDANVEAEPTEIVFVDLDTMKIKHLDTTCGEIASGNMLPAKIGLIPGELVWGLPHFAVTGDGWGSNVPAAAVTSEAAVQITPGPLPTALSGESKFDSENRGLKCGQAGPALGNNQDGLSEISSSWDKQCIYIVDAAKSIGGIQGKPAIGLVRGVDIQSAAATFDASIWVIPSDWVALSNAKQFATDNCPNNLPILVYEGGNWSTLEVFTCP
jgi:hypothetical protein